MTRRVRIKHRAKAKAGAKPSVEKLTCTRRVSAEKLDTSIATIRRLEAEGRLSKIRLRNKPTAKVYNVIAEVEAIAAGSR